MNFDDKARVAALLAFWFGTPEAPDYNQPREIWFTTDPAFDEALRQRFGSDQQRAAAGGCDGWLEAADPALALVLLLDQLPRNLYRGTAGAFATDAQARAAAREALARGFDQALPPVRRAFLYLPFEHSEDLADQETSLRLYGALGNEEQLRYARRHHEIVARFGRFPHRNRALGRPSTAAEEAFLKEPFSSF